MRFSTDDGLFGFIVTPVSASGMYRFQLVIQGEQVGDAEPCFLETAMSSLGKLHQLDDSRLARISVDTASVMAIIDADDVLHDAALLQVAESLDGWKVRGYVYNGDATVLAQKYAPGSSVSEGLVLFSVLPLTEYWSVLHASHDYWAQTRYGMQQ
jgi:hypothetical protein